MGGFGSGRWRQHDKAVVVEECAAVSLKEFVKRGLLRSPATFVLTVRVGESKTDLALTYRLVRDAPSDLKVRLIYTAGSRFKGQVVQDVPLTGTTSPVAGLQWWFSCPLVNEGKPCGRRVDKLYLPPGSNYFACRGCHNLTYRSCQESHYWESLVRGLGVTPTEQKQVVRFFERRRARFEV